MCVFLSLSLFHFKSPISKRAETRFSLSSPLCPRLLSLPPPVSLSDSVSNLSVLPSTRKKTKNCSEPPKFRKKNSNFVDYITNPLTLPQWNNIAATKENTHTHTHTERNEKPTHPNSEKKKPSAKRSSSQTIAGRFIEHILKPSNQQSYVSLVSLIIN